MGPRNRVDASIVPDLVTYLESDPAKVFFRPENDRVAGLGGTDSSRWPSLEAIESLEPSEPIVESRTLAAYRLESDLECQQGVEEGLPIVRNQTFDSLARCSHFRRNCPDLGQRVPRRNLSFPRP